MELSKDLRCALEAARLAAPILREGFESIHTIQAKGAPFDVVTNVDLESERVICEYIKAHSAYPILSEEQGTDKVPNGTFWVVDPLDGTLNFSRKIPLCVISIALISNVKTQVAVIMDPFQERCYFAERGQGAYCNKQKISVSDRTQLSESMFFLDHGYDEYSRQVHAKVVSNLASTSFTRTLGATALEHCYVAQGSIEACATIGDKYWDSAAGVLIVEEAGGRVSDWEGKSWDHTSTTIITSNGHIHQQSISLLNEAISK